MWTIIKFIAKEIFGNKSSLVFALVFIIPVIGTAVWKWNAWLDKRDEAVETRIERDQFKQAAETYAQAYDDTRARNENDQQTMLNLGQQKDAADAVAEQAKKELREYVSNEKETKCGKWSTTVVPDFPKRVLLEFLRQTRDPSRLYGGCTGVAAGCAAARLRDALDGTVDNHVRVPGKPDQKH